MGSVTPQVCSAAARGVGKGVGRFVSAPVFRRALMPHLLR